MSVGAIIAVGANADGRRGSGHNAGVIVSDPYAVALVTELSKPRLDHLNLFQNIKETGLAREIDTSQ